MQIKTIDRQVVYEGKKTKVGIVGPTFAVCPDGSMIMTAAISDGSDSGVGNMLWRSYDEGETWTQEDYVERSFQCDPSGSMKKVGGNAALYADTKAGVILFTSNEGFWECGNYISTKKCYHPFYRLSFDSGRTWTDKHYIITEGHTFNNPIRDVVYGRNFTLSMASQTLRADDGDLLVALQTQMVDENDELIEPAGFHFFECGALRATWQPETLTYRWEMGDYVQVTPQESMRGLFEPTFARIGENSFIMVMRNSNMGVEGVIGQKFYAVSHDNGRSWTRPKPLTYDDGTTMYSSSSVPKLLSHSNGKTYYIGVINDRNPNSNGPRCPFAIAELDTKTCTIVKDTVTILDTVRPEHMLYPDPENHVDYTNHGVYEDSKHRIIVYAPFNHGLNRYEISL